MTLFFQIVYTENQSLLQRIQIRPELSNRNKIPLQKCVSVILSKTCGGKSRVKQSHVSMGESFPGKVRCTTIKLLSRSMHLLFSKDSILKDKTADRPVNLKIFQDYKNLVLLICEDISRKLQLKFIASAAILTKVGIGGVGACFVLNLTFYVRSTIFRTVS